MKERRPLGLPRRPALLVTSLLVIAAVFLAPNAAPGSGSTQARFVAPPTAQSEPVGTPVAAPVGPAKRQRDDPLDGDVNQGSDDPLDGDPLDGPRRVDSGSPDEGRLAIARSGRPDTQPLTLAAYDDDPETLWTPEATPPGEEPWLWLDLGEERRLREVRWLVRGSGAITVAISHDRQRWRSFDAVDVRHGWERIALDDDARYVRLSLAPAAAGALPSLAEVTVYGAQRAREAPPNDHRDERRQQRGDRGGSGDPVVESAQKADKENGKGNGNGRIDVSAEKGETHCKGKKARCEAKEGRVTVEEDCAGNGSCVIDVQANGGSATCDASGGDAPRDGRDEKQRERGDRRDENRRDRDDARDEPRGARGGRCEAVANGGTVTIGDINP